MYFQSIWFISIFIYFMYKFVIYHYDHWKKLNVPHTKPALLLGHFKDVYMGRRTFTEVLHSLYQHFDEHRYFGVFETRKPVLVIRDPELLHTVMVNDFGHFHDRTANNVSSKHDELFNNLTNDRGEKWKTLRSKLSPTFTASKIKLMLIDIGICSSRMMDALSKRMTNNNGIVDVSELMANYTTETIGRCAFGLDCNVLSNPNSEFHRICQDVFPKTLRARFIKFIRIFGLGHLLDVFRVRGLSNYIYDFFFDLLKNTIEQRKIEKNSRNDFIANLIKLKDEEMLNNGGKNKLFTKETLAANIFIFFFAGFETSASTLSYCLYELALNPDIQNKLRKHIKETINTNNGDLSYDTLKDMTYLDMVVNETLRMHPSVSLLIRVCTKKYTLPETDITLNVGEKVFISVYGLHYDPKYYPKPEIFDPQRFTNENKKLRPQCTFLPFGDGPRMCIGMRFALIKIKRGLAEIISRYEVSPCKETQIPIKYNTKVFGLLITKDPIKLSFKTIE